MKELIERIGKEIIFLLTEHEEQLVKTWNDLDEGDRLTATIPIKLSRDRNTPVCEINLSFVALKVKDSTVFTWKDQKDTQIDLIPVSSNKEKTA